MSVPLCTIGYEGADIRSFLAMLRLAGIVHLIDVRDVPLSRKPGFSKKALSLALDGVGIAYTHLKALGDPKVGRDAMRRGDYKAFQKIYDDHLNAPEGQAALQSAVDIAAVTKSALLCFERAPSQCHRSIVAREMEALHAFEVQHLGVNIAHTKRSANAVAGPGAAETAAA